MSHPTRSIRCVHHRRGDTSLVVRLHPTELPCIRHWGPGRGDQPVGEEVEPEV